MTNTVRFTYVPEDSFIQQVLSDGYQYVSKPYSSWYTRPFGYIAAVIDTFARSIFVVIAAPFVATHRCCDCLGDAVISLYQGECRAALRSLRDGAQQLIYTLLTMGSAVVLPFLALLGPRRAYDWALTQDGILSGVVGWALLGLAYQFYVPLSAAFVLYGRLAMESVKSCNNDALLNFIKFFKLKFSTYS